MLLAIGETTRGIPVTGKYTLSPIDGTKIRIDVVFVNGSGVQCTAGKEIPVRSTLSSMPITCMNGTTGSLTLTSDYINLRGTIIYRLNNGEAGKLISGRTVQAS